MTKKEKWIVDEDDGLRLFYGDENFNGSAYPCNDIVFMKMIANKLNKLEDENEQLKQELKEFKDFVFSDEKILCYSCVNCISKGIYEVECYVKGKVDVHGFCFDYWKNEVIV